MTTGTVELIVQPDAHDVVDEMRVRGERTGSEKRKPHWASYVRGCSLILAELAEREGFEPPIRLPVCRISSAVHSTTLPPLRAK